MDGLPLLSLLIFFPSLGALCLFCIPQGEETAGTNVKNTAFFVSLVTFCVALIIWGVYDPIEPGYQLTEKREWISDLGIFYVVGVDGLSIPFILLVTGVVPLTFSLLSHNENGYQNANYLLLLILETSLLGSFCALNLFLFYVFSSCSLISFVFILFSSVQKEGEKKLWTVIFWNILGSMIFLGAIVFLSFDFYSSFFTEVLHHSLSLKTQWILWAVFFIYFLGTLFLFPSYIASSLGLHKRVSAGDILGGIGFMALGFYGMVRFVMTFFPQIMASCGPWIQPFLVVALLGGSVWVLRKEELSKLGPLLVIFQSLVSLLALFFVTNEGVLGGLCLITTQLIVWVGVLFCVEGVTQRLQETPFEGHYRPSGKPMLLSFFVTLFLFSGIGFPGTMGFMGVFLILMSACSVSLLMGACLFVSFMLYAFALLYGSVYLFSTNGVEVKKGFVPLKGREILPLALLGTTLIILGLFPSTLTVMLTPSVESMMKAKDENAPVGDAPIQNPKGLKKTFYFQAEGLSV